MSYVSMVSPSFVGERGWIPSHFLSPLQHFASLNQLAFPASAWHRTVEWNGVPMVWLRSLDDGRM
jgi:hypothetical protein